MICLCNCLNDKICHSQKNHLALIKLALNLILVEDLTNIKTSILTN